MKRLSYMACLLLASAAFTACDEDFKDWADPQSNPQEEAITAMVDITPVASMKLEEQPGDSVVIASVSSIAENFSLTACNIELVAEGQILNLPSKVKDGNIKVRLTELDQKVASLYKSQKSLEREVTLKLTPVVMTTNGEATSLTEYPEMQSAITPVATPAVDTSFFASRFFTTIAKVQSANRFIEYPRHQKPDRPYFPLKVILYNVRR